MLVLCEDNLALWNKLKLTRLTQREPEHLSVAVADVRHQLATHLDADQDLLARLEETVRLLTDPTGYEGLAPLRKRKLSKAREHLKADLGWFAERRSLDFELGEELRYANFRTSVTHALHTGANAMKAVTEVVHVSAQPKPSIGAGVSRLEHDDASATAPQTELEAHKANAGPPK